MSFEEIIDEVDCWKTILTNKEKKGIEKFLKQKKNYHYKFLEGKNET